MCWPGWPNWDGHLRNPGAASDCWSEARIEGWRDYDHASGEGPVLGEQPTSAVGASMTWSGRKQPGCFGGAYLQKRTCKRGQVTSQPERRAPALRSGTMAQRLDQNPERRRGLALARIVQVIAWERLAPIREHPNKLARGDVSRDVVLGQVT